MSRILIVGCGDVGRRLAQLHLQAGDAVTGLVRTASSVTLLESMGISAVLADLDQDSVARQTDAFDIVYHLAPPPGDGTNDSRTTRLLGYLSPPSRLVYMSTTAVYGDANGDWLDERTLPAPGTDRGRRRLDAETQLLQWGAQHGSEVVILRVAAIYGPGRLPLERVKAGAVAVRPEHATPTNRIHADDLAAVCLAAGRRGKHGDIFNCADGQPATQAEYLTELAALIGAPKPELVDASEVRPEFVIENKRVRADRLRDDLGVALRNPDFKAGLRAILAD